MIDAFSSSQCKRHWNALISYVSFSIRPLNPIKVVSIASLLSHKALFISFCSLQNPLLSRFSLTRSFFLTLFVSDFRTRVILFHFFHTVFFRNIPPPSQFHILSNSFTVTRVSFVLSPSYSLIFTLHTFVTSFLPFFSPDFLIFTSQSFYRCPSHSIQIKEYHCAI